MHELAQMGAWQHPLRGRALTGRVSLLARQKRSPFSFNLQHGDTTKRAPESSEIRDALKHVAVAKPKCVGGGQERNAPGKDVMLQHVLPKMHDVARKTLISVCLLRTGKYAVMNE